MFVGGFGAPLPAAGRSVSCVKFVFCTTKTRRRDKIHGDYPRVLSSHYGAVTVSKLFIFMFLFFPSNAQVERARPIFTRHASNHAIPPKCFLGDTMTYNFNKGSIFPPHQVPKVPIRDFRDLMSQKPHERFQASRPEGTMKKTSNISQTTRPPTGKNPIFEKLGSNCSKEFRCSKIPRMGKSQPNKAILPFGKCLFVCWLLNGTSTKRPLVPGL
jgi:hypothetical protein